MTKKAPPGTRASLLLRLEANLVRQDSPRLLMMLMVAVTGGAGLVTTIVLHRAGVDRMWLRYGLAFLAAYGTFMLQIWAWVLYRRGKHPDDVYDWDPGNENHCEDASVAEGAGPDQLVPGAPDSSLASAGSTDRGGGASGGWGIDVDEWAIPIVIAAAILAVLVAAGYVVLMAPSLMAELLLDGVLATALYRKLRRLERRHWLESAIRRTWLAATILLVVFVVAGFVLQRHAPEASTLGEIIGH